MTAEGKTGGDPAGPATRPNAVLAVVGVGTLLSALAGSTVNLALPELGRDLHISIEWSRWVVQAFLLASGTLLLPAGRLSDLWGHRRVYLAGFTIFALMSLACGLAPDFFWLVVFRLLQGAGGAMIMASGPALLTTSFSADKRGRALGMLATATYTGLTVGPSLGGFIVAAAGWRYTFYFNVPVGLIVLLLGLRYLGRATRTERSAFDWTGCAVLVAGLPLLLLGISMIRGWGILSWKTWSTTAAGAACIAAFVILERNHRAPILNLDLFRSRTFTGATLSAVANYVALFVPILLAPFYLEEGLGRSTAATGLVLSAQPLVMAVVASPSGWLSDRIGTRGLATAGMVIMAMGAFGLSTTGPSEHIVLVAVWLGVIGLGTGIFISPNSNALMGSAPGHQQGAAGGVLAEARTLGMLVGVALASSVYQAAGGRTGIKWGPQDFEAWQMSLWVAAAVALLGAVAAALRGAETEFRS